MKSTAILLITLCAALVSCASYDRLTPQNAALLLVDHQTGLANGVRDQTLEEFQNAAIGLAKIGKLFNLPTILTTSAETGPNGPLLPGIKNMFPTAEVIMRPGQINAWDNPDFVRAVNATGRRKLIIAGISTEVCVAFVALSAVNAGYDAYAVIDASGTWNELVQRVAIDRMVQAGVVPITMFAVASELQYDWRMPTRQGFTNIIAQHLPFYGNLISSYNTAFEVGEAAAN